MCGAGERVMSEGGVSGKHEGAMDGSSFLEWDPKLKKKRASLLA